MIPVILQKRIAKDCLCSTGQQIPWAEFFAKPQLNVAFLGGSVTNGYREGATLPQPYPALVCEGLRQMGYAVTETVLSAPGMDSMVGNLLCDEIVLSAKPDLAVLEFAINETTLRHSVLSFESLLRKLLTADKPPIVVVFLLRSAGGYSCDGFMAPMAAHYGLPLVNFRPGIEAALAENALTWEDYADQEAHPTPEGHQLLAECMLHLLRTARAEAAPMPSAWPVLPEYWMDAPFTHLRYLRPEQSGQAQEMLCPIKWNWAFPQAWRVSPEQPRLELHLHGRALVLFYQLHHLPEFGSCRVTVDGRPPLKHPLMKNDVLHGDSVYGWGQPVYLPVLAEDTPADHVVVLESVEKNFFLLGIGYCE